MHDHITPYNKTDTSKKEQVSEMFDNVASGYDRLNRIITFGMDVKWRKRIVDIIKNTKAQSLLDIATGTGDMAILFAQHGIGQVKGIDISKGMLEVADQKIKKQGLERIVTLEVGDAEHLPYDDEAFDAASVTYGIRNFENLEKGLTEIRRVLAPAGTLVILETSVPDRFPMRQGYMIYTKYVLPLVGRIFSKDKSAYSYLSESAIAFPYGERLKAILLKVGFKDVELKPQVQGISTIYVCKK